MIYMSHMFLFGFWLGNTIDREIKAKRHRIISELVTFRIVKAKAKVNFV